MNMEKSLKVVLVGDCQCGKSALLRKGTDHTFVQEYQPTVFDSSSATIISDQNYGRTVNIWDTSGSAEFDHVRSLTYAGAHVFAMCFDIGRPVTLENISSKWLPEVRSAKDSKLKPIVLVGCKRDTRSGSVQPAADIACDSRSGSVQSSGDIASVTFEKGESTARQIGAVAYVECSSKFDDDASIDKLFNIVAMAALGKLKKISRPDRIIGASIFEAAKSGKLKCAIM